MESDEVHNIPEPSDSGSSGNQEASPENEVIEVQASALDGLHIPKAVSTLGASSSRHFGGEIGSTLMPAIVNQLADDRSEARQEVREMRYEVKDLRDKLSEANKRAAVLEERLRSAANNRHLRNIAISFGSILIGIAIELIRNQYSIYGSAAGVLGVLMVYLGWLAKSGETDKC